MKPQRSVAVVGGGMMGVALSHDLAKAGYATTLYEAADRLGGLATYEDFGAFTWDRFYHCILPSDAHLLEFLEELGLKDQIRWSETRTGIFIDGRIFEINTGLDFARFTALSLWERFRLALTILRCGMIRNLKDMDDRTAREWFVRAGGLRPYLRIWRPLLATKFGDAADRVSPIFLAAKVKRMLTARRDTSGRENLGYVSGGYRRVWTRCAQRLEELGVELELRTQVMSIDPEGDGCRILTDTGPRSHSRVILTTPFELGRKLTAAWPGGSPVPSRASVEYMGLVCLILALRRRVVSHYVLNLADQGFPFTGVIGMTDLISTDEVNGYELAYVPKYVDSHDALFEVSDEDVFASFFPALQRIYPDLQEEDVASWFVRRARIVQPVQVVGYSRNVPQPDFESSPVTVVNNAQLLQTDLHNSAVVRLARSSVRRLLELDRRQE